MKVIYSIGYEAIETVYIYEEWLKEYNRRKTKRRIRQRTEHLYYMKQRLSGVMMVTIGIIVPFLLDGDDTNYLEPDISITCDSSKLDDKGCHGAPDWIIEIVSPGNKPMDYFTKLFKYRTAGVREYWIVDPTREMITVYRFEKETMEQYSFGEDVSAGIYDDFSICIR